MSVEIKAGQIWESITNKYPATIEWADGKQVLYRRGPPENYRADLLDAAIFPTYFQLRPAPKTRYINKDDIMKMLAEYGVIYSRIKGEGRGKWMIAHVPEYLHKDLDGLEISPNPFAPNPIIVGPEIEVVE